MLGGWHERIHTEDIALKCFEIAPSKFSWTKYPKYPDLASVYFALGDAKKPKYGSLVKGERESKREIHRIGGWSLTPKGIEWIEKNKSRIEESIGRNIAVYDRLPSDRKLKELFESKAYKKFLLERDQTNISYPEFVESLICTVNTAKEILRERLDLYLLISKEKKISDVKDYIFFCQTKFREFLE